MSIFDVKIGKVLGLPDHLTTRVMFIYDQENKTKEFRIFGNNITPETKQKIYSWLKETIVDVKIIQALGSNEMDADRYLNAGNF
jgi:hypothetical protein